LSLTVYEFFLADQDMRPDERTDPILSAVEDVVGCHYPGRRGPAEARWSDPTAIHMGMVRVSRAALAMLAAEHNAQS